MKQLLENWETFQYFLENRGNPCKPLYLMFYVIYPIKIQFNLKENSMSKFVSYRFDDKNNVSVHCREKSFHVFVGY